MFANSEELLRYLANEDVKFVDVRFCDLPGVMQHFNLPVESFDDSVFSDGLAFDGSSIRGFQSIHESDMLLLPDVATAFIDPFRAQKTLALNFFVHDPFTREAYSRDPRNVAKKAEAYLAASGIADTAYFGAEAEFYIIDSIRHETSAHQSFYYIDSIEGAWNSGRIEEGGNRGYKTAYKGGYFPVPPVDHYADLRDRIVRRLVDGGFTVERSHHEVGTAGQSEINYKFSTLLHAADQLQLFKYIVKNETWAAGKTATFMPKPFADRTGSGMHMHLSLWRDGAPVFPDHTDPRGLGLSPTAYAFIGGILEHAGGLQGVLAPTVNSYKRTGATSTSSGATWSPRRPTYGGNDRTHYLRVPDASRVELRGGDGSANPYLASAVTVAAGLDGIRRGTDPGEPGGGICPDDLPMTLLHAMDALGKDAVVTGALDAAGPGVADYFTALKRDEFFEWHSTVTPWEVDSYLTAF